MNFKSPPFPPSPAHSTVPIICHIPCADPEWGLGVRTTPGILAKNVIIGFVNGTGLILHSIYVEYNPDEICGWCRLELKSVFS